MNSALKWTRERPSEPGWYWRRHGDSVWIVHYIHMKGRGLGRFITNGFGEEVFFHIDSLTSGNEFAGPLPEPTEEEAERGAAGENR